MKTLMQSMLTRNRVIDPYAEGFRAGYSGATHRFSDTLKLHAAQRHAEARLPFVQQKARLDQDVPRLVRFCKAARKKLSQAEKKPAPPLIVVDQRREASLIFSVLYLVAASVFILGDVALARVTVGKVIKLPMVGPDAIEGWVFVLGL